MSVCAYFDSSDNSLNFVENTGGWTNGQVVDTKTYYTGFEEDVYNTTNRPPWDDRRGDVEIVNFYVLVKPISTAYWFFNFSGLTRINSLNLLNTSEVTSMGDMFNSCTSLTSLDLSSFNTSKVTDMSSMFCNSALTLLNLSSFDTSEVTNMRDMFYNCTSLISLDLSSFDTSNVTDMIWMFGSCTSLTSLNLSSFDTSKVTDMVGMFRNCTSLTSLDLSSFDTSNVTNMIYMFRDCSLLKYIRVSNLWSLVKVTSSTGMFDGCTSLSNYNASYKDKTRAYAGYHAGYPGYLVNSACAYYDSSDNSLNFVGNDNNYADKTVVGTKTYYKNIETSIYTLAVLPQWNNIAASIKEVKILMPVKPTSTSYWFKNCTNLSHIDLNLLDTSNVIYMSYMFEGCSSLISLNLSNFNTNNVTDMSYMFYKCPSLTSLDLSSFDTSNVTDMIGMFSLCTSLTSLDLSNFNTSKVTKMGAMFENCKSLTSLNLSSFDTSNVIDMASMFNGCTSLTSLDLSGFNTSKVTSMSTMFNYCSALTSLNLNSFNTSEVRYMHSMFSNCSSLTSLNLSSFNTSKITDVTSMFLGDSRLTVIIWDPDTTKDYSQMFSDVTDLYIIRPTTQRTNTTLATKWRNIIGNNSEVHFEYDHTLKPTITHTIERGKKVDNQWTPDDTEGTVIKLTYTPTVYQNDFSPLLEANALDNTTRAIYSDNTDISSLVTYTTEGTAIIAEFDIGDAAQHNITLQLQDKHDSPTLVNITLPGIFAMIEFRAGGKGMSIGKVATRDGLDIAIPTTIGDNLLYPTIIENGTDTGKIDLDNFQFTIGQYNSKDDSKAFIIGNGGYDTSIAQIKRSNALTVDWSGNTEQQGRATTNDMSTTDINNFVNDLNFRQSSLIDFFYPVGSYYETSDTTFDPNIAWGGTWVKDSAGRVTVAQDASNTDLDTVGDTGGSATVTLGTNEIPAHTHNSKTLTGSFSAYRWGNGSTSGIMTVTGNQKNMKGTGGDTIAHTSYTVNATHTHDSVGGGQAHNNMQPYIVVNRWHRTA